MEDELSADEQLVKACAQVVEQVRIEQTGSIYQDRYIENQQVVTTDDEICFCWEERNTCGETSEEVWPVSWDEICRDMLFTF